MEIATKIAQWLWTKNRVREAQPVAVQIAYHTYAAARYVEVQKGGNRQTRLFCVGTLPPFHDQQVALLPNGPRLGTRLASDCLVSAEPTLHRVERSSTDSCSHFILALYTPLETWAVDQCGRKPYRRIRMVITTIGPPLSNVKESTEETGDK